MIVHGVLKSIIGGKKCVIKIVRKDKPNRLRISGFPDDLI